MKWADANLEPFYNQKGIEIYLDENYVKGWWKSYPDFKYLYVNDKNKTNGGLRNCITMFNDGDELGYFICETKFITSNEYGFNAYDSFVNILEFGLDDCAEKDVQYLIDYLFLYARYMGAKFIKISKKENYEDFYSLMSPYATANNIDYLIIKVENTNLYEDFLHLRVYDDDNLSFEELCFLYCRKFTLNRFDCVFKNGDDVITINRKTRLISLPSFVKNDGALPLLLDKENYGLLAYLSMSFKTVKELGLTVGLQIDDLPYRFSLLGEERLLVFSDFSLCENVFEILYKIRRYSTAKYYSNYNVNLVKDYLWQGYSFSHHNINSDLEKARLCLDLDVYYAFPPTSAVTKNNEFSNRLNSLTEFAFAIENKTFKTKRISAKKNGDSFLITTVDENQKQKQFYINSKNFLSVLKNAHFCNWQRDYKKPIKDFPCVWAIVLKFGEEVESFRGANDYPKIWKYFIGDLKELLDL